MKLKLDEQGHVVVVDGKPVYVDDNGKDVVFDYAGTVQTIGRLNAEAKANRERYELAESGLKAFEGISDAKEAMKALEVVKNLEAKKLVDAGEVEKVRAEAIKAVEEKYSPVIKERDSLQAALVEEKIGGSFSRSKWIGENMLIPPDMAQAKFGNHFKLEGSQITAYDVNGQKIYSRSNPGELAGFDEAMELIVDKYQYRDNILKGSGASGSGVQGGQGGSGVRQITRAQFDNASATEKSAWGIAASKGEIQITD